MTRPRPSSNPAGLAFVAAIVLLTRLPFLTPGLGNDGDAWRVACVAAGIAATGEYAASRLPGYPLHELLASLVWRGGPWVLNGVTALFSVLAAVAFARVWHRLGFDGAAAAGLALALTPVVYTNSTVLLDYVWALALVLVAVDLVLSARAGLAGLALGLAVGCRLTSGAMLLPLGWLLARRGVRPAALGKLAVATLATAGFLFVPVAARYGLGFLDYNPAPELGWAETAERAAFGVWGGTGLLALAVGAAAVFRRRSLPADAPVFALAVALYLIAFAVLPIDAGYLVPTVPFVLLLLAGVPCKLRYGLFALIAVGALVAVDRHGVRRGPVLQAHTTRKLMHALLTDAIARADAVERPTTVVAGSLLPAVRFTLVARAPDRAAAWSPPDAVAENRPFTAGPVEWVFTLDAEELQARRGARELRTLPGAGQFNRYATGVHLTESAEPLSR